MKQRCCGWQPKVSPVIISGELYYDSPVTGYQRDCHPTLCHSYNKGQCIPHHHYSLINTFPLATAEIQSPQL